MNPNIDDLQFYSGYPIDKIVQEDKVTYTLAAGTPVSFGVPPNALETIPNSYKQKCFIRASWALDGVNFNSTLTTLEYYSATFMEPIIKASVSVGVDDSSVYFWLVNNFTSDLTYTINYAVYSIS